MLAGLRGLIRYWPCRCGGSGTGRWEGLGLGPGGSGDQLNNQYWLMAGGVCYVQICRRGS